MERERYRSPSARWLQPDPVPFWATRIFRWNLIICALALSGVAFYGLVLEPGRVAEERRAAEKALAAATYVPRDPASTAPREVRFDGLLDLAKDDDPLDAKDDAYRHLVRYLGKADPAMLAKQARTVDYKLFKERPAEVRGLTVRIQALFWEIPRGPERLDKAVGGVETMTRAYLAPTGAARNIYIVDFVEAPPDIERETPVVVDAVFLRRVKFERDLPDGKVEFHEAPLFLARNISKVEERAPMVGYNFRWVVVMMAIGVLGALSMITIRGWMRQRADAPASSPTPRRIPD